MEYFVFAIYFIVIIFLLLIFMGFIRSLVLMFRKDFVPFVPLPSKLIPHIISIIKLDNRSVFYDLGCGDGRIVRIFNKLYPFSSCTGIEKKLFPYFLGKIKNIFNKSENFKLTYGDIFDYSYSDATHIFTYLFPKFMDSILPKLESELKSGTKLFSVDFQFSKKKYYDVIEINSRRLAKHKIYIYVF